MLEKSKWIYHPLDNKESRLVPVFKKKFQVNKGLTEAHLKITAHGVYEPLINGRKITNKKFMPGLTSYYYRLQVQEFDIKNYLSLGENEWITQVGDGWWRWNNNFGYQLALLGEIELVYKNENDETQIVNIPTDESFLVRTEYIQASDLQMGEIYDATKEEEPWVSVLTQELDDKVELIADESEPIREKEVFQGQAFKDSNGDVVVDFGQNICGAIKMTLRGTTKGQKIHIKHGELLNPEGRFSTANCDGGKEKFQEITYICNGNAVELYQPEFSYFGFRYALVEGLNEKQIQSTLAKKEMDENYCCFESIAIYSDLEEVGDFECSNENINQLVKNARWSQKGNFLDVPVDCPTRERNAWTGDAQIYVNTACYFMNCEKFFLKWLKDQSIEQYASGKVGITFPSTSSVHNPEELAFVKEKDSNMELAGPEGNGNIGEDSVGWGDSAVHLPYELYRMYENIDFIKEHYATAKKWLEYSLKSMKEENPYYKDADWYQYGDGEFIYDSKFHYGEWNEPLPPSKETIEFFRTGGKPSEYVKYMATFGQPEVATAYTKRSCDEMIQMAKLLLQYLNQNGSVDNISKEDLEKDIQRYEYYSKEIKRCYNNYMIHEDGTIKEGHQAPYVRALALNLVDQNHYNLVVDKLKDEIKKADYHLNTGFLSTGYLLPVLADCGLKEEAFRILEQTDSPGWLHPVTIGATTIPENWTGFDEFRDSLNHYSFGAVCQFLFEYVGGIRPKKEENGFSHIELRPLLGGSLTYAKATYKTKWGLIQSEWRLENKKFSYQCEIPEGVIADLYLPDGRIEQLCGGTHSF
ncbi:MAG: glycoside hydrolase family 78 protein [Lachnospiraceae bacterium]|nr:glycoside hydrolase family 78 protein [Lachnospiraceae bacterium]